MDKTITVEVLKSVLVEFRDDRNWQQYHTPRNLAEAISIEAAELLECFQWGQERLDDAAMELADVMIYCLNLADVLRLDVAEIIMEKIELNGGKYPPDEVKVW